MKNSFDWLRKTGWLWLAVAGALGSAKAEILYWDGSGTPNTNWALQANWNTAPDGSGSDPLAAPGAGSIAWFNVSSLNSAQTATLAAALSVSGFVFSSTAQTDIKTDGIANRTITLGAAGLTINAGAGPVVFGTTVDKFRLPFTLGATQTWQNNSANTLILNSQNTINLNAKLLTFDGTGGINASGVVSSTTAGNGIIKTGTGSLYLGASNTFNGGITLNNGTLVLGNNGALGIAAGVFKLAGGTVDVTAARTTANNNPQNWIGDFTFGGSFNWDTGNGAVTLLGGSRTVTVRTNMLTVGGVIDDGVNTYGLIKAGAGNLTLTNVNTYGGLTDIRTGALIISIPSALPGWNAAGRYAISNGAILAVGNAVLDSEIATIRDTGYFADGASLGFDTTLANREYAPVFSNTTTSVLGLAKLGANTLTLSGANNFSGPVTINGGALNISNAAALGVGGSALTVNSGTLWNSGSLTVNNRDLVLAGPFTNSADAGTTLVFANPVTGTGSLVKVGTGTLIFSNAAGNATLNASSGFQVKAGTFVQVGGSITSIHNSVDYVGNANGDIATNVLGGTAVFRKLQNNFVVGNNAAAWGMLQVQENALLSVQTNFYAGATGTGLVYLAGGSIYAGRTVYVGANAGGVGVINQTGGALRQANQLYMGNNASAYGMYQLSGGVMTNTTWIQVGAAGQGLLYQYGGTNLITGSGLIIGGSTSTGTVYLAGGLTTLSSGVPIWVGYNNGSFGRGEFTVDGTATVLLSNASVGINRQAAAGTNATGFLNLNGGVLQASSIFKGYNSTNTGYAVVNFNGGTFRAAQTGVIMGSASGSVDAAYVRTGGAIIDDNGLAVTISQDLLAPPTGGLTGLSLSGSGLGGFVGAPYVAISGNGTGATAIAQTDLTLGSLTYGQVTNLIITSPGVGYTLAPVVTLMGGGSTNPTVPTVSIGANGSGSLTKQGAGMLTLSGANTYTGGTVIQAGSLLATTTNALPGYATAGRLAVSNGATLAINYGGGSDWNTTQINNLLGNSGAFAAGSALGFDTSNGSGEWATAITLAGAGVTKLGPNTLVLSGANSFGGGVTINGGILNVTNDTALGTGNSLTFNGGALQTSGDMTLSNRTVTLAGAGTNVVDAGTTLTITNNISGAGAWTKAGGGTLTLTGDANLGGAPLVSEGTLNVSGNVSAGANNIYLGKLANSTATVNIQGGSVSGANFMVGNLAAATGIVVQTAGAVSFGTAIQDGSTVGSYGEYHLYGGTLNAGPNLYVGVNHNTHGLFEMTNGQMWATSLLLGRSGNFATNVTAYYHQSGGTATVTTLYVGGGSLTTNTYGYFAVSNGVFSASAFSALAGSPNNTGVLYFGKGSLVTLPSFPTTRGSSGTYTELTMDGGTLSPYATSLNYMSNLTYAFLTTNGGTLNVGYGKDILIVQKLQDAVGVGQNGILIKQGAGVLTLSGANTYSGGTIVSNGALSLATTSAQPPAGTINVLSNAALALGVGSAGGFFTSANVDTLWANGMAGVAMNADALVGIDTTAGDFLYATPQATRGLVKLGTNNLTLTGNNTYPGMTIAANGTLTLSNTTGGLTVPGNFQIGNAAAAGANVLVRMEASDQIASSAILTFAGSYGRLLLLGHTNTVAGISDPGTNGVIEVNDAAVTDTNSGPSLLVVNNTADFVYAGYLRDSNKTGPSNRLALTKSGSGVLTLSGSQITYSLPTTVNGGTLILTNTSGFNSMVTINGGRLLLATANAMGGDRDITNLVAQGVGFLATNAFTIGGLSGTGDIALTNDAGAAVTLTLGGGNQSGAFSGSLSGAGSLVKSGTGLQVLNGVNTFSGTTLLTGGRLQLGLFNALPANGAVSMAGGIYDLNGFPNVTNGAITMSSGGISNGTLVGSSYTFSGGTAYANLAGSGALTNSGGVTTLSGTNTFTGGMALEGGMLSIGDYVNLPAAGNLHVNGGTLQVTGSLITNLVGYAINWGTFNGGLSVGAGGTLLVADSIGGAGSLTKTGTGTLVLSGVNSYNGGTRLNGGVLTFNNDAALGTSGDITFGGGTLRYGSGITLDLSARIKNSTGAIAIDTTNLPVTFASVLDDSNIGGLTKSGGGVLVLNAVNSFSGTTTISNGVLQLGLFNALPATAAVTVRGGGYDLNTFPNVTNGVVTLSGGVISNGTLVGASYAFSGGTATANLAGTGTVTKTGTGTTTLGGSNTYSGGTFISAGQLTLNNNAALGSGTLVMTSTAVRVTVGDGVTITNAIALYNNSGASGRGLLEYAGASTGAFSGPITISNIAAAGGHFGSTGAGGTLVIAGAVTSSVGVVSRIGTVVFSGGGSYADFSISQDTVKLGANNGLATNAVLQVAGSATGLFDFNGFSQTLAGLRDSSFTRTITNTVNATQVVLTLGNPNPTNHVYSGRIDGNIALLMNGTYTQTLSGTTIKYTGPTTINGGVLALTNTTAFVSPTTINGGQLLLLSSTAAQLVTITNAAASDGLGFSATTNAYTVGGLAGTGNVALTNAGGVNVALSLGNNNVDLVYGGVLSQGGSLTKVGTGVLQLTGANSYSGGTFVNGGLLAFGASALPPTGNVLINSAGALVATGAYGSVVNWLGSGRLDTASAGALAMVGDNSETIDFATGGFNSLFLGMAAGSTGTYSGAWAFNGTTYRLGGGGGVLTYPAAIGGSSNLVVGGGNGGTVVLTAASSFGGGTLVNNGNTLRVGITDALPTTGGVSLGEGTGAGHLDLPSYSQTIGQLLVQSTGAFATNMINIGAGQTLTINGAGGLTNGVDFGGTTSTTNRLVVSGAGSLVVTNTAAYVVIGRAQAVDTSSSSGILDLSGLGSVILGSSAVPLNEVRVGYGQKSSGQLTLSDTNNLITATALQVGHSLGSNAGATGGTLILGAGVNTLAVDKLTIGLSKANGVVKFASQTNGSAGTVTIGGKSGATTEITIGSKTGTGTGATITGTLNLLGHPAYVTAGALTNGIETGGGAGSAFGNLYFDNGVFTVTSIVMAAKSGANTTTATATLMVGGGEFTVNPGGSFSLASQTGTGSANGTLTLSGGVFRSYAPITVGPSNCTSTINLNGGTLDMTGASIGSAAAPLGVLNLQSGTLMNLGQFNGGAALVKSTAGTLTIAGTNAYSGDTIPNAGTLVIGSTLALTNSTLNYTNAAGTVSFIGGTTAFTLGGLAGTQNIGLTNLSGNAITLTVGGNNTASTNSGVLSGGGGLTKTGNSVLALNASNSYTGWTLVGEGVLRLDRQDALSPASVGAVVSNGARLQFASHTTNAVPLTLSGSGIGTAPAAYGALLLNENTGVFELQGPITLAGGAAINTYNAGKALVTMDQGIGGTGDLTLRASAANNGGALYILKGQSSYNGNTYLAVSNVNFNGLTVQLGINDALPTTTVLNLQAQSVAARTNTATLMLDGYNQTLAGLVSTNGGGGLNTNRVIGGAATLSILTLHTTGDSFFDGSLGSVGVNDNNLALVMGGSGTQTLAAAYANNSYVGGTTISNGLLRMGQDNPLGSGLVTMAGGSLGTYGGSWQLTNTVNLATSGNFDTSAGNLALTGAITNGGNLVKSGVGTLTLSGANSYSGTTTISNGTLKLASGATLSSSTRVYVDSLGVLDLDGNSLAIAGLTGASGSMVTNGGGGLTLQLVNATNVFGGVLTGASTFTLTGGGTLRLTGTNNFGGGTLVSNANYFVNGLHNGGVITVISNGLVGGNGPLSTLVVGSGGVYAPGNSIATQYVASLTLANAGILEMELGNGAQVNDRSIVTNSLTISGGLLKLDLRAYSLVAGASYTLVDWTGASDFDPLNAAQWLTLMDVGGPSNGVLWAQGMMLPVVGQSGSTNLFTINYGDNLANGHKITLTAVPEPGTASLLGLVGVAWLVRRIRRRCTAQG